MTILSSVADVRTQMSGALFNSQCQGLRGCTFTLHCALTSYTNKSNKVVKLLLIPWCSTNLNMDIFGLWKEVKFVHLVIHGICEIGIEIGNCITRLHLIILYYNKVIIKIFVELIERDSIFCYLYYDYIIYHLFWFFKVLIKFFAVIFMNVKISNMY